MMDMAYLLVVGIGLGFVGDGEECDYVWHGCLLLLRAVAEAKCEESDCVGEEGDYHREPPLLYVADVFDDCCYGGDSAEDGEYWDHGDSPLLRVVVLSGIFSDIQLYAKPVPKGKCDFQAKIAGWRIRAICVDGCIYKIVYRNAFSYAMQNTKGPASAGPKNLRQKCKWVCDLSWNAFGLSTGSGTLFIRFCS